MCPSPAVDDAASPSPDSAPDDNATAPTAYAPAVAPPRRRSTEAVRGLRVGGLLTAVAAGGWAWWQTAHYHGAFHLSDDVRNTALGGGLVLVVGACLVWLPLASAISQAKRPHALIRALLVVSPYAAGSVLFGWLWWRESQDVQMSYPVLAQLAVAAAGLGIAAVSDLQLRRTGRRGVTSSARTARIRRMNGVSSGTTMLTLVVAAVTLAALPTLYAPTSVQVVATDPAPIPETLADEVRWQRVIQHDDPHYVTGVIAGAAGPVVVTRYGVMGLDSSTGETTWSYSRSAALETIARNCFKSTSAPCDAVLTPDRTRLVLGYGYDPLETVFVVLNASTGEVVFERTYKNASRLEENRDNPWNYRNPTVQVTDHVLVIEQEVLSLTDGSLVSTLPDERAPSLNEGNRWECPRDDSVHCRNYWPPSRAGHSTLVLGITCWSPDNDPNNYSDDTWCEMEVAPDSDPSAVTTVSGIVPSADHDHGPETADGWTVRYADPGAAYEELSRHNLLEEADSLSFPLEAVNLDTLAGVDDAGPVALGDLNRPEHYESAHTLAVLGATSQEKDATIQVRFDPATRQAVTSDDMSVQPTGAGYLDALRLTRSWPDDGVDLVRSDETVVMHLEYPSADQQEHLRFFGKYLYLVQTPGAVIVVDHRSIQRADASDSDYESVGYETVIYGVG
ncbi:hypothetical protein [Actinomyces sp. MRS3W]|uniref:hypothetical protein n=1 Tax=Actinomyces sp. MRS3W TaxID=2800796 RepID=UPI0028FD02AA|nr:hypothetical protein [Actinomyces sp. MRS3W]MDU0347960.1 hypothetical protein [Actinomyces sp. MRS3W]